MESRDGLPNTGRTYANSAFDLSVRPPTISKTLTRITLYIGEGVRRKCRAISDLAYARREVNDLVSHEDLDESSSVHSGLRLP